MTLSTQPAEDLTTRAWRRFKANRRGYISLWIFGILFVLSLFAEVLSHDKPLIIYYNVRYCDLM